MGVDIDEARRHGQSARIDLVGTRLRNPCRDGADATTGDAHVGADTGRTSAVEERAAANDDVVPVAAPRQPGWLDHRPDNGTAGR